MHLEYKVRYRVNGDAFRDWIFNDAGITITTDPDVAKNIVKQLQDCNRVPTFEVQLMCREVSDWCLCAETATVNQQK